MSISPFSPAEPPTPAALVLDRRDGEFAGPGHHAWRPAAAGVAAVVAIIALVAAVMIGTRVGGAGSSTLPPAMAVGVARLTVQIAGLTLALAALERGLRQAVPRPDAYALAVRERLLARRTGRPSLVGSLLWALLTATAVTLWGRVGGGG